MHVRPVKGETDERRRSPGNYGAAAAGSVVSANDGRETFSSLIWSVFGFRGGISLYLICVLKSLFFIFIFFNKLLLRILKGPTLSLFHV